ncbi:actin depolymerizing protein [Coniochaeta ligniaria NRRL 30616]|uniref:Actin depolymerizing protein n=1 Tax=Coniochaeta ligniaria NRRL 30616 TaxID=1408157 RepID=A0A1J7IIA5_9PEZI|nr:actin depolymerizing protein [Coniochaeta ligniaria NRRL 30616]
MAPHAGLVHLKEYDIKDSNVELIGTAIDHKVKYASAASEPAWNDGRVGVEPGVFVWRIEDFEVVPWTVREGGGVFFYDGDSYIVLSAVPTKADPGSGARQVGGNSNRHLIHEIFFWLGSHTSQDEAGVAAYKTVELDEFLHGTAIQHRELQSCISDAFRVLFPRLTIRKGGVRSGFRHVDLEGDAAREDGTATLLRVFQPVNGSVVVVCEVEPTWRSLDDGDVFILDVGEKIWVWQGSKCRPMEKAKAAQVVHDMKLAKHVEEEVLSQTEPRSRVIIKLLGGDSEEGSQRSEYSCPRPVTGLSLATPKRPRRLFRLSDASGELRFDLVKEGEGISRHDLDSNDVFLLDNEGNSIWVWEGSGASKAERTMWLSVAQSYVRQLASSGEDSEGYMSPIAKVRDGYESVEFEKAMGGPQGI